MTDDPHRDIARRIEEAEPIGEEDDLDLDAGGGSMPPLPPQDGGGGDGFGEPDPEIVRHCAGLDHSDTDNGLRLVAHFGRDLSVMAQDEVSGGAWLAWTGTHWDLANGLALAKLIAQQLGTRMLLETWHIMPTQREDRDIAAAEPLRELSRAELDDAQRALLTKGDAAEAALRKRRQRRRAFAITSRNKGRMDAALDCAAPHLRRAPDAYNRDRYRVASLTHTLRFHREIDPEDPERKRQIGRVKAIPGHAREDWITCVIPQPYDPEAQAPTWRAFLERMLPDPQKRRTVHQFTALGMLGVPVQFLMFHYGKGSNGKSVYLETVMRLLGPSLGVGMPRESIVGGSERSSGGASPDIARLYGKRLVRITEIPPGEKLQEDLIKRLTGGEAITVRALYKGFFEFLNFATPHMSGNGFPQIDGTDEGIWRRMLLVHWDQFIPEAERGEFEDVVTGFLREGPGILNWMIEGVLDFLTDGLVIAPSVRKDTGKYREDMDPAGEFLHACVKRSPGQRVQANEMFQAYLSYCLANAKRPLSLTRFGRRVTETYEKSEISGRIFYHDCELHDVPERPEDPARHDAPYPRK